MTVKSKGKAKTALTSTSDVSQVDVTTNEALGNEPTPAIVLGEHVTGENPGPGNEEYDQARAAAMIGDDTAVASFYRAYAFPHYEGRPTTQLDDKALLESVFSVDKEKYSDIDDLDDARCDAIKEGEPAEQTDVKTMEIAAATADDLERLVIRAAMMAGKGLQAIVSQEIVHIQKSKVGPLTVMLGMTKEYGDKLFALFPMPYSTSASGLKIWDKYEKKDDEGKIKARSFYKSFYNLTEDGANVQTQLKYMKEVKNSGKGNTIISDENPYQTWSDMQVLGQRIREFEAKATHGTKLYREAMRLYYQLMMVELHMPLVQCDLPTNADGSISLTPTPVILMPSALAVWPDKDPTKLTLEEMQKVGAEQGRQASPYTVSKFLALNVAKALKMPGKGTLAELKVSNKKKGPDQKAKPLTIEPSTSVKDWVKVFEAFNTLFDPESAEGQLKLSQLQKAMADEKTGDEVIEIVGDVFSYTLATIWGEIMANYQEIQAKRLKAKKPTTKQGQTVN